jgi:hypothetical protein
MPSEFFIVLDAKTYLLFLCFLVDYSSLQDLCWYFSLNAMKLITCSLFTSFSLSLLKRSDYVGYFFNHLYLDFLFCSCNFLLCRNASV